MLWTEYAFQHTDVTLNSPINLYTDGCKSEEVVLMPKSSLKSSQIILNPTQNSSRAQNTFGFYGEPTVVFFSKLRLIGMPIEISVSFYAPEITKESYCVPNNIS